MEITRSKFLLNLNLIKSPTVTIFILYNFLAKKYPIIPKQIAFVKISVTKDENPFSTNRPGFPMILLAPNHVAKMVTPTKDVERLFPARVKSVVVLIRLEAQKPIANVIAIYKGINTTSIEE